VKAPKEAKVEVRELEPEHLPRRPDTATTTTDRPVAPETKRTIAAALMQALRTRKALR